MAIPVKQNRLFPGNRQVHGGPPRLLCMAASRPCRASSAAPSSVKGNLAPVFTIVTLYGKICAELCAGTTVRRTDAKEACGESDRV
jgi:hypothetical protein